MARTVMLDRINAVLEKLELSSAIETGFVAYSNNEVVVPPVGELIFDSPPGDTHIKYGYIKDDDYFVIKIASGFYENIKLGLPSSSGLMLVFSQKTGLLDTILLDEGHLTNVRTAVAGQIAARYLAPRKITAIGVFGTGIQARMQVEYLKPMTDCRELVVWGRSQESLDSYRSEMEHMGFRVTTTQQASEVPESCNLIITATPSDVPLIAVKDVRPGTHITAMGSDTSEKQEVDPEILASADIVVADSISQCLERGEIFKAIQAGKLDQERVRELGHVIQNPALGRQTDSQITLADLTGVAVQDIQIAKAVCRALEN